MLRGSWCIVIAVAGLALGAANKGPIAPNSVSGNESGAQAKASSKAPSALPQVQPAPEPNKAEPKDRGCTNGKERRDSDLCAQWKAADAAFDGARATERQTIIGWIGLLLGSITMAAAIAAALYAKRAAVATEATVGIATEAAAGAVEALNIAARNADAAVRLADATETVNSSQFRPYLWLPSAKFESTKLHPSSFVFSLENMGFLPAIVKKITYSILWMTDDGELEIITKDTIECGWMIATKSAAELPINVKGRPSRGNDFGIVCLIAEIAYEDSGGKDFSVPASFQSEQLTSFESLTDKTKFSLTLTQVAPHDADPENYNEI